MIIICDPMFYIILLYIGLLLSLFLGYIRAMLIFLGPYYI